ncbi:MAG: PEP-CTERM sorting domain-containing protein, partial [Candidatus Omnitrophica bacterium]|nr:PEP-CTERM sorting domain-containing protein [Candidatus Omnitrophota bacterium]
AQFGTAAELATAATALTVSGGLVEDGWAALQFAMGYSFRPGASVNVILVTDEDRDELNSNGLTYDGVRDQLAAVGALLNVAVNHGFEDVNEDEALGVDADGNAYVPDGAGGYAISTGGVATTPGALAPTAKADYIDMAWELGGAAWDLNILRDGGDSARSFTAAFIDIKVSEISGGGGGGPVIPEPASLGLFALGALGFGIRRRKKQSSR